MKKYCVCILIFLYIFKISLRANSIESLEFSHEINNDNNSIHLYKDIDANVEVFNKNREISNSDVELMAKVVFAESRAEPYEGKVAVASVILNRLYHPKFPDTIKEVIIEKNAFSCVNNGEINVKADETCISAVKDALDGIDPTGDALFFYNPKISTSVWMKDVSKENIKIIGNHVFFYSN